MNGGAKPSHFFSSLSFKKTVSHLLSFHFQMKKSCPTEPNTFSWDFWTTVPITYTTQRLDAQGNTSCLTPFCKFSAEWRGGEGGIDVPDFYRSAQEGENKTYKGPSTTLLCVRKKVLTKIQSIIF